MAVSAVLKELVHVVKKKYLVSFKTQFFVSFFYVNLPY